MEDINILWTGGLDSTYRMLQLSKFDIKIQPYYLSDKIRRSEGKELEAISAIMEDIKFHHETRCTIFPLKIIKVKDIIPDKEMDQSYRNLYRLAFIGPQYLWLSEFAKTVKGLELCIETAQHGRAQNCIIKYGRIIKVCKKGVPYCVVDSEKSGSDVVRIFGNFRFPLPLFEYTKRQIIEEYKRLGFEETMNKTWFCHTPFRGEPCGTCNPCKSVMEEGLSFRLSESAIKRYRTEVRFENYWWFRFYKKFRLKLAGY